MVAPAGDEMRAATAALRIQRLWRGFAVRRGYHRSWVEWLINDQVTKYQAEKALEQERALSLSPQEMLQQQAAQLQRQRMVTQEEVLRRSEVSEWEVEERRAVYQQHMYHRLLVELQAIEGKVRQLLWLEAERTVSDLHQNLQTQSAAAVQRAATRIQAQWRGFTHRRTMAARISDSRQRWEARCDLEDQFTFAEERTALEAEAVEGLQEVAEAQDQEWRELTGTLAAAIRQTLEGQAAVQGRRAVEAGEAAARQAIAQQWGRSSAALWEALERAVAHEQQLAAVARQGHAAAALLFLEAEEGHRRRRLEAEWGSDSAVVAQGQLSVFFALERSQRCLVEAEDVCWRGWLHMAHASQQHRQRWQQWKAVTMLLGLCVVVHFQGVQSDLRVRAAAEFAEESVRAALQAGEATARQHVERKRDWERRMVAGRARRQALEAVELQARDQVAAEAQSALALLQDRLQVGIAAVHCRRVKARVLQRWVRQRLKRFRWLRERQRHFAAVRIQAAWRGLRCRRDFACLLERREEAETLWRLQDVERRQLHRLETEAARELEQRWTAVWSAARLQRQLAAARRRTAAGLTLQRWLRTLLRRQRARQARESLPERQERAGRQVLVSEWEWKSKSILEEGLRERQQLRRQARSGASAIALQRLWRGHAVRRRMPKYAALKEEVTGITRLWRVERQSLMREEHDAWLDLSRDLERDRREIDRGRKLPPPLEPDTVQEARRLEAEAAAQRKRTQEAARRRQAEFNEELSVIAAEERLERRGVLRAYEGWLAEVQETFLAGQHTATFTPWLLASQAAPSPAAALATPLGPLRPPRLPSAAVPAPPLAEALAPPPRPAEGLPALKRVPLPPGAVGRPAWGAAVPRPLGGSPLRPPSTGLLDAPPFATTLPPPRNPPRPGSPLSNSNGRRKAATFGQSGGPGGPAAALPAVLPQLRRPK